MVTGFMIQTPADRVLVNRGFGSQFEAVTTHALYGVKLVDEKPVRGDFFGIGITDDRGHELYAQPDQLTPL